MNKQMSGALLDGAQEFEGASVTEAIEAGLRELDLPREEAEVRIVHKGSRGFLGIGARPARVVVTSKRLFAPAVRDMARELLELMRVDAEVTVAQNGLTVEVDVRSGDSDGLLIGRKGETLASLHHLLTRMAARRFDGRGVRIQVDVAGYRRRRDEQLRETARALAERVVRTGRRAMTEPLPPAERRTVHRALAEVPGVRSHAAGSGVNKRVILIAERGAAPVEAP